MHTVNYLGGIHRFNRHPRAALEQKLSKNHHWEDLLDNSCVHWRSWKHRAQVTRTENTEANPPFFLLLCSTVTYWQYWYWYFWFSATNLNGMASRVVLNHPTMPSDWGLKGVVLVLSISGILHTSWNNRDSKFRPWSVWSWLGTPNLEQSTQKRVVPSFLRTNKIGDAHAGWRFDYSTL